MCCYVCLYSCLHLVQCLFTSMTSIENIIIQRLVSSHLPMVYIVQCIKCNDQYIGQTKKTLEDRFIQHLSYVANNTQATAQHFNQPSHNNSHMTWKRFIRSQIDRAHREGRKSHWIMRFNFKYKGMNKKR